MQIEGRQCKHVVLLNSFSTHEIQKTMEIALVSFVTRGATNLDFPSTAGTKNL